MSSFVSVFLLEPAAEASTRAKCAFYDLIPLVSLKDLDPVPGVEAADLSRARKCLGEVFTTCTQGVSNLKGVWGNEREEMAVPSSCK